MELELNFTANAFVDFAIGAVIKGKEHQGFQEYFPAIGSVLQELEIQNIASYAVLDCNLEGGKPEQGAFSFFKKVENFHAFYQDPRVQKVIHLRDEAMIFLNDGNMFETTGQILSVDSERDYALIFSSEHIIEIAPLMEMKLHENSPNKVFNGKTLSIYNWGDEAEKLMYSEQATVFRIRFFPKG